MVFFTKGDEMLQDLRSNLQKLSHRQFQRFAIFTTAWFITKGFIPEQVCRDGERKKNGRIIVTTGEMFSGKSAELIRLLLRNSFAGIPFVVFKPQTDSRTPKEIKCRNGPKIEAINFVRAIEILEYIIAHPKVRVIGIDEAQFCGHDIIEIVRQLADIYHITVLIAGLDMDFMGQPFGPMPQLMAIATEVHKVHAVCTEPGCGRTATYSRLTVSSDSQIFIGDSEFRAVCRMHRPF